LTHLTPRVVPKSCPEPVACAQSARCRGLCAFSTVLRTSRAGVPLVARPPVPTPGQLRAAAELHNHLLREDPNTQDRPLEQLIPDGFTVTDPQIVAVVTEAIGHPPRVPANNTLGITAALLRSELRRWAFLHPSPDRDPA
jgi:hypothetical protein